MAAPRTLAPIVTSPCLGTCRIDPESDLCGGCARSGAEIAGWKDADPADRARVWADLPRRRRLLGIAVHRLGWQPDAIADFVHETLQADAGRWTVGSLIAPRSPGTVTRQDSMVAATVPAAAIRFAITDRVRVLAIPPPGGGERIVLAVPRGSATPRPVAGLTPLGPDRGAIRAADRDDRVFDLGLGGESAACLRTPDRDLASELDRRAGRAWADVRTELADQLGAARPCWVVANPIARVESLAPPRWSALDPGSPPAPDLPAAFLAVATFDPAG